jgi:hypothetical protein
MKPGKMLQNCVFNYLIIAKTSLTNNPAKLVVMVLQEKRKNNFFKLFY